MFFCVLSIITSLFAGVGENYKIKPNYSDTVVTNKPIEQSTSTTQNITEEQGSDYALIHNDKGFFPSKIVVKSGSNVKILIVGIAGRGASESSFIIDEYNVHKGVSTGEVSEVTFKAGKQGAYKFYCPITNKKGWLIVQ
jgi:plastocyanin domain-containing protein